MRLICPDIGPSTVLWDSSLWRHRAEAHGSGTPSAGRGWFPFLEGRLRCWLPSHSGLVAEEIAPAPLPGMLHGEAQQISLTLCEADDVFKEGRVYIAPLRRIRFIDFRPYCRHVSYEHLNFSPKRPHARYLVLILKYTFRNAGYRWLQRHGTL